jgi:hypothetical protein
MHHQQAIVIMRLKKAQHKCFQYGGSYQELRRFFLLRPDP